MHYRDFAPVGRGVGIDRRPGSPFYLEHRYTKIARSRTMAPAIQPKLPTLPPTPQLDGRFDQDVQAIQSYLAQTANTAPEQRQAVRDAKEAFFRRHAAAMYDALTDNGAKTLRVNEVVYGAAERF